MRDQADHVERLAHEESEDINLESLRAYQSSNAVAQSVSSIIANVHKEENGRPVVAKFKFRDGTSHVVALITNLKGK